MGKNPSNSYCLTVVRKKLVTPSPVSTSAVANTTKKSTIHMIGERSFSVHSVVKRGSAGILFLSLDFPLK
jgi:hypothetical protein